MTKRQEKHLSDLMARSASLMNAKYRHGQKAHGGDLFELSAVTLLNEAINEAIDQLVYLLTLKDRLQ